MSEQTQAYIGIFLFIVTVTGVIGVWVLSYFIATTGSKNKIEVETNE